MSTIDELKKTRVELVSSLDKDLLDKILLERTIKRKRERLRNISAAIKEESNKPQVTYDVVHFIGDTDAENVDFYDDFIRKNDALKKAEVLIKEFPQRPLEIRKWVQLKNGKIKPTSDGEKYETILYYGGEE